MNDAPETKALGTDVGAAFEDFSRAFEAFKETNDQRLGALETRRPVDVLVEEKLARIDAALDEAKARLDRLALEARRPPLGGTSEPVAPLVGEHKSAFDAYVRTGEAGGLKALEEKALSAGSGPDGGYLVPAQVESEVLRRLAAVSPIRAIASVRLISTGTYKRAVATAGPATGWVGEEAPRPHTSGPTLAEQSFPAMELYAMPAATQTLLDDAVVDIDAWLAEEVETAFAEQEGRPSSTATASTSPRASSPMTASPTGAGAGAISAPSRPGSPAPFGRRLRPTCSSTSSMRSRPATARTPPSCSTARRRASSAR